MRLDPLQLREQPQICFDCQRLWFFCVESCIRLNTLLAHAHPFARNPQAEPIEGRKRPARRTILAEGNLVSPFQTLHSMMAVHLCRTLFINRIQEYYSLIYINYHLYVMKKKQAKLPINQKRLIFFLKQLIIRQQKYFCPGHTIVDEIFFGLVDSFLDHSNQYFSFILYELLRYLRIQQDYSYLL